MATIKDIHKYQDIINTPYHKSHRHQPMSQLERAAQFAPFAALTGHKELLAEAERFVDKKRVLDRSQIDIINKKLNDIMAHIQHMPLITMTYFQADLKKKGGRYITITKRVKKVDEYEKVLIMENHTKIKMQDIYNIVFIKQADE